MALPFDEHEVSDFFTLKDRLDRSGWVLLKRLSPGITSEIVAAEIGGAMAPKDGSMVQRLVPQETGAPNTYSGNFGLRGFPFHTDLAHWRTPPRYLMLRCIKGYSDVPTLVIDGNELVSRIGQEGMRRAVVRPRRPQGGEMRLLRLLQDSGDERILRWDEVYLKPASPIGEAAFLKVRECIERSSPTALALEDEGDTLIIDNWRMLHSRPAIPHERRDRHLERVYLRTVQ